MNDPGKRGRPRSFVEAAAAMAGADPALLAATEEAAAHLRAHARGRQQRRTLRRLERVLALVREAREEGEVGDGERKARPDRAAGG